MLSLTTDKLRHEKVTTEEIHQIGFNRNNNEILSVKLHNNNLVFLARDFGIVTCIAKDFINRLGEVCYGLLC